MLGRGVAWGAGAVAALTLAWAGGATWYIVAKDDLAQRFFAHQTELRYAYEDRIADLKGRLEREVTFNLVERTGFERRAETLARRQGEIEARQAWLRSLAERTGSGRPRSPLEAHKPRIEETVGAVLSDTKPVPVAEPFALRLGVTGDAAAARPVERPSQGLPSQGPQSQGSQSQALPSHDLSPHRAGSSRPHDRLSAIERSLERVSGEGGRIVEALRRETDGRLARVRAALAATGLDPDRLAATPATGIGGPLVSLPASEHTHPSAPVAAEVDARASELGRLQAIANGLPLARPVAGEADPTSAFGYRVDPFTRAPALHTGLDFRAEAGAPILATGAGRVVAAEFTGGYGQMVEIDHGGGVTTRYGHLSGYAVAAGERVAAGQLIGRAGSTGRSTGPHLHYETRINGEPVNPQRFLLAGAAMAEAAAP